MTNQDFVTFRGELSERRIVECDNKSKTYATDEDRLINFKRNGERYNMTPFQCLGIYLGKHIDSIETFIRSGEENREGVEQNIIDAMNYLELLAALVHERAHPHTSEDTTGRPK